jgi:hypothetical protein
MKTIFKVVHWVNETYFSAFFCLYPEDVRVTYPIGEWVSANVGPLFAFEDYDAAWDFKGGIGYELRTRGYSANQLEIFEGVAKVRPGVPRADILDPGFLDADVLKAFWRPKPKGLKWLTQSLLDRTVLCSAIRLDTIARL